MDVEKYNQFVTNVLQPRLEWAIKEQEKVENDMKEYEKVLDFVNMKSKPDKMLVEIGMQYRVRGKVSESEYIYVDIGLGFLIAMKYDEVKAFIPKKLAWLRDKREKYVSQSQQIASHIQEILLSLRALKNSFTC